MKKGAASAKKLRQKTYYFFEILSPRGAYNPFPGMLLYCCKTHYSRADRCISKARAVPFLDHAHSGF